MKKMKRWLLQGCAGILPALLSVANVSAARGRFALSEILERDCKFQPYEEVASFLSSVSSYAGQISLMALRSSCVGVGAFNESMI